MKRSLLKLSLLVAIVLSVATTADAQVYVSIRPNAPVFARPHAPSPRHIWIDGDWIGRGGRYSYSNGYWIVPPRRGVRWIPGHWKSTRRGWVWMRGHWRR